MGERGRPPEPLALRLLKNTNHKPYNDQAPSFQLPAGVPECPEWLWEDEVAVKEWAELTTLMSAVKGWLTEVNKTTLAGHCHWYSVWIAAEKVLANEGRFFNVIIGQDTETGETAVAKKLHPAVRIAKEAWQSMIICDKELGITPARDSSVRVPSGDQRDEEGLDGTG